MGSSGTPTCPHESDVENAAADWNTGNIRGSKVNLYIHLIFLCKVKVWICFICNLLF